MSPTDLAFCQGVMTTLTAAAFLIIFFSVGYALGKDDR